MANTDKLENGDVTPESSIPATDSSQAPTQPSVQIPFEQGPAKVVTESGEVYETSADVENLTANPTVRPVTLGSQVQAQGTPVGAFPDEDLEAVSAYKTLEARRKRKRRNRIIAGCVVGALAIGAGGFWALNNIAPGSSTVEEESYSIGYASVETYEKSVSASGAIKPVSQVVVSPEIEGIVSEVMVAEGDNVLKGDVLFTLKNDKLDRDVEDAERAVSAAEHGVTTAQDSFNNAAIKLAEAQSNYDKVYSTLYDTQEIADAAGAEATDAFNAAQMAYNSAEGALDDAQGAVTKARETLEDAQITAEKRTVRAPEGGAIVAMHADVGASIGTGSSTNSTPLVTIADLSTLLVSVQVNEVDINNLSEGQEAEVTFSALPDVMLKANVKHIAAISSSTGDNNTAGGVVTYGVDLIIEDPDAQVKPGMTARVKIVTEQIENALTVPIAALQMTGEKEATLTVAPGYKGEGTPQFEERKVSVITQDASTAVIEGNVSEGDAVKLLFDAAEDSFSM